MIGCANAVVLNAFWQSGNFSEIARIFLIFGRGQGTDFLEQSQA